MAKKKPLTCYKEVESPYFKTERKLKALLDEMIKENIHSCSCYERGDYNCPCDKLNRGDFIRLLEVLLDE